MFINVDVRFSVFYFSHFHMRPVIKVNVLLMFLFCFIVGRSQRHSSQQLVDRKYILGGKFFVHQEGGINSDYNIIMAHLLCTKYLHTNVRFGFREYQQEKNQFGNYSKIQSKVLKAKKYLIDNFEQKDLNKGLQIDDKIYKQWKIDISKQNLPS